MLNDAKITNSSHLKLLFSVKQNVSIQTMSGERKKKEKNNSNRSNYSACMLVGGGGVDDRLPLF